jgi:hypothetical protein
MSMILPGEVVCHLQHFLAVTLPIIAARILSCFSCVNTTEFSAVVSHKRLAIGQPLDHPLTFILSGYKVSPWGMWTINGEFIFVKQSPPLLAGGEICYT